MTPDFTSLSQSNLCSSQLANEGFMIMNIDAFWRHLRLFLYISQGWILGRSVAGTPSSVNNEVVCSLRCRCPRSFCSGQCSDTAVFVAVAHKASAQVSAVFVAVALIAFAQVRAVFVAVAQKASAQVSAVLVAVALVTYAQVSKGTERQERAVKTLQQSYPK